MRNLIAAIDLGTSKVVCLVGEKTDTGVKIIAINEAPTKGISRGEVINIQSVLDAMTPTIRNVENAIGEKINDVFIGIAGQGIKCIQGTNQTTRVNPDDYITQEEIEQVKRLELSQLEKVDTERFICIIPLSEAENCIKKGYEPENFVLSLPRFTFDEDNFFVDLVFYNRLLQCYVLIDLKTDKLTHQDLGQMQMYVNYFDRYVKQDFEKPTIGILLCETKNDSLVELTLPKDANIYAQQYALCLPDKKLLKEKLREWIDEFNEMNNTIIS